MLNQRTRHSQVGDVSAHRSRACKRNQPWDRMFDECIADLAARTDYNVQHSLWHTGFFKDFGQQKSSRDGRVL